MDTNKLIEEKVPEHLQKSNVTGSIKSFVDEFTVSEENVDDVNNAIFIDTAKGQELDTLGAFFKLSRASNETDVDYRTRIKKAREKALVSGVRNLIEEYLQELLGSYATVTESSLTPLKLTVKLPLGTNFSLATVQNLIESIKMAGVKVFYTTDVFGEEALVMRSTFRQPVNLNIRFLADINKPESRVWLS